MRLKRLMFALLSSAISFQNVQAAETEKETVSIGVIAPLTGVVPDNGSDIARTIAVSEELLAAQNLHFNYKFLLEDGRCAADSSPITAYRKLRGVDDIRFFIAGCSGEVLQVAPVANREKVILFAVNATHPDVRNAGEFVYRTYLDIERGVEAISKRIIKDGKKSIALITEEVAFTQGIKNLLLPVLEKEKMLALAEDFQPENSDFRSILLRAIKSNPDAIYLNCAGVRECMALYRGMNELKIKVPIYTYYFPEQKELLTSIPQLIEGTVFIGLPVTDQGSELYQRVASRFQEKYQTTPVAEFTARATFDALWSMVQAIENVGTDTEKVRQYLDQIDTPGALGRIRYDSNGDIKDLNFVLKQIKNGKVEVLQ